MRGPPPKPLHLRQRRNKVSTQAMLPSREESAGRPVPPLPARQRGAGRWHPRVVAWWKSVWRSPMAGELLGPDVLGGLHLLAELYQRRWTETDTSALVRIASEIRQQEVRFGLSPIDRRRLQWEVEKGEQAEEQTKKRRERKSVPTEPVEDPRDVLKVVA